MNRITIPYSSAADNLSVIFVKQWDIGAALSELDLSVIYLFINTLVCSGIIVGRIGGDRIKQNVFVYRFGIRLSTVLTRNIKKQVNTSNRTPFNGNEDILAEIRDLGKS